LEAQIGLDQIAVSSDHSVAPQTNSEAIKIVLLRTFPAVRKSEDRMVARDQGSSK